MNLENITPDTLDQCDREYDRLDDLYRRRKPVLDAYEQWKILAQQYAEFQVETKLENDESMKTFLFSRKNQLQQLDFTNEVILQSKNKQNENDLLLPYRKLNELV